MSNTVSRYGSQGDFLQGVYKTRFKRDYINQSFLINDISTQSPLYFNFAPIPTELTAGKNVIKLLANGPYLEGISEIDCEVLDAAGNPIYTEYTGYQDRYGYKYITVYVYDNTQLGTGTITFVGTAAANRDGYLLNDEQKKGYNLKWSTRVEIKPTERNITDIIFQKAPIASISQILVPYKFNLGTYALASRLVTQSFSNLEIVQADFSDIDFTQNQSIDILDQLSVDNTYNYFAQSLTANTVETNIRKLNREVVNGYVYSEYSRYNTILYDSASRLTKDMEGSIFSFPHKNTEAEYTASFGFEPSYRIGTITPTGSIVDELNAYTSKIVYVINSKYALLENGPTITVQDSRNTITPLIRRQSFKKITGVSGSFIYPTSSLNEIRSQNISSSLVQFTLTDVDPIAGDIYRIKTYIKEAGSNTEYYQVNDHIVRPPEYLIDSDKSNQAAYAKNKSEFFVYGEFTDIEVVNNYWRGFGVEADNNIYQYTNNTTSSQVLANSVVLTSKNTLKKGIASRYYQTYIPNQAFSLSFYCALDPGCELEVYMGSNPLKGTVLGLQGPKAFYESRNYDSTYDSGYSRFGKLIGKISNISGSLLKHYDNVIFDFFPDEDGFGRPVFFLNNTSAEERSAYISSVSITPLDLVGYTPGILQFAAAPPDTMWILQDDDASLTQSIDVKVEYFTFDGRQSEYTTYIPNVQLNLITEVPGFCVAENYAFNDHCTLYYEVTSSGTTNTTSSGIVTANPRSYYNNYATEPTPDLYFWPTYSINSFNGFYWNIINFGIGESYNTESLAWHTSSTSINTLWRRFDPIMPVYDQAMPGTAPFTEMYSASSAGVFSIGDDNQYFWKSNGAVISPIDILYAAKPTYSNSLSIQSSQAETNTLNTYLKQTRLHFPTNDEIFNYGFNENGGIYNVKFNLKRWPQYQKASPPLTNTNTIAGVQYNDAGYAGGSSQFLTYNPIIQTIDNRYATQDGAKLMVYIHDVTTPLVTGSKWQKGTSGFFPPDNNIVTVGNGYSTTPTLRYYDSGSGAYIDIYDIILVQYGDRAQLVFDASGIELTVDNNDYFNIKHVSVSGSNDYPPIWGGLISDIEWCKIGTTTDPRFIKPSNFTETFADKPKKGTWIPDDIIGTTSATLNANDNI